MKNEWPLWEIISREALVELAHYQWENYRTKLDVLLHSTHVEPLNEIKKLMAEAPHSPKRVV